MKHLFTFLLLGLPAFGFAQCQPNTAYANEDIGFYPTSASTCGSFTFTSETQTIVTVNQPFPIGDVDVWYDAFRIVEVQGLPAGLSVTTDVMGTADGSSPYGIWYNTGSTPNQQSIQGCFKVTGSLSALQQAAGNYAIQVTLDARIAQTSPAGLIDIGSWISGAAPYAAPYVFGLTLQVQPCCNPVSVSLDLAQTSFCATDAVVTLTGGSPQGGSYEIDGQPATEIDPSQLSEGAHTVSYSYSDGGCSDEAEVTINILSAAECCPTVDLELNPGIVCSNDAPFALAGGVPVGGVYTINNQPLTMFDPAQFPLGANAVTYTYTEGQCSGFAGNTMTVNEAPEVEILGNHVIQPLTQYNYTIVAPPAGTDILWEATNGTVTNGQGTNTVSIFWDATGTGQAKVTVDNGTCSESDVFLVSPTGIEDQVRSLMSIHPNPSSGLFQMELVGSGEVRVLDVLGKQILSRHYSEGTFVLDLSNEPDGIYLVQLQTADGQASWKLLKE